MVASVPRNSSISLSTLIELHNLWQTDIFGDCLHAPLPLPSPCHQCCQRMTEPWPQATCTLNLMKSGRVFLRFNRKLCCQICFALLSSKCLIGDNMCTSHHNVMTVFCHIDVTVPNLIKELFHFLARTVWTWICSTLLYVTGSLYWMKQIGCLIWALSHRYVVLSREIACLLPAYVRLWCSVLHFQRRSRYHLLHLLRCPYTVYSAAFATRIAHSAVCESVC